MQENLNRIFSILSTYENFEPYMLNHDQSINSSLLRNHINLWVSQFDDSEKEFIVEITANLLEQRFITKDKEIKFIQSLFENNLLLQNKTMPFPLKIQGNGKSQSCLVKHYEYFMNYYNLTYSSDSFIYIDDFVFSGGRLFNDLSNWIPLQRKSNIIFVAVMGQHTNIWIKKNLLQSKIYKTNQIKGINSSLIFLKCVELENRLFKKNESGILWPMISFFQNEAYAPYMEPKFIYRDGFIATSNNFFKNNEDRVKFENICLKYGFQIIQRCQNPNATTKPLGNSFFGYGFGGLVFNYRNCPNNTPLIFWWGSSNPSDPMYNQWHPLMPRRTYG
ncbi:hypothetical protein ACF8D3_06425 [Acinetobacter sp. YQ_14]|uniref:phosphoribosyltransferase-like protein n=1 Tax=Acinetobacter sp. YQ_14 TaxID=3367236 RepID=UPI00370AC664